MTRGVRLEAPQRHSVGREDESETRDNAPAVLVDTVLAPEAEAARRSVELALIPAADRRAVAVFLGRDDYEKQETAATPVMASLLMECLPALVRERGGQVVLITQFQGDVMVNATQMTVTTGGKVRPIVVQGYVFMDLPGERIVVSVGREEEGPDVISRLVVRSSRDAVRFLRQWTAFAREHNYLRGQAFFADGKTLERKRAYTWDDIVLPESVCQAVRLHVEGFLRNVTRLRALGVKARRGLILEGPPGTGKTLLGKVLADTLDCSFIWVTPRHIRPWKPSDFADVLEVARFVAPSVVFLEDLDVFAEERNIRGDICLGELMNQLDGAVDNEAILTIATTNRLEVIEKAIRNRPGRFDRVLHIGDMDDDCRRRLLERILAKAEVSPADMAHLVSTTDGYTGAQIEELANTLYMLAVDGWAAASGDGDGLPPTVVIDRPLIAAALDEFRVERKIRVGFDRTR